MPNTSFPSLEDSPILDEITADIIKEKEATPLGDFTEEYKKSETARVTPLRAGRGSMTPTLTRRRKSSAWGSTLERGIRQMELLENNASIMAYGEVFAKAPQLKGYFA